MTDYATVQNLTAGPVIIDADGRVLGAGEFAPAAVRTDLVRDLIRDNIVGVVSEAPPERQQAAEYVEAHRATLALAKADENTARPVDVVEPKPARRASSATTAQEG